MLDVNEYGVVALDERALMAIEGGDGGCAELAYAIGYAVGWLAYNVIHGDVHFDANLTGDSYAMY